MKRMYSVDIPALYHKDKSVTINFPRKKDAEYFVNKALCSKKKARPEIKYTPCDRYPDGINWYTIGNRYVYIIWSNSVLWKCTYIGYHIDTAERHDIVFGNPTIGFEVVVISTNCKDAIDKGKNLINKAKEAGRWSKQNRSGYI